MHPEAPPSPPRRRFRWPPRPIEVLPPEPRAPDPSAPKPAPRTLPRSRLAAAWDEIERVWLGLEVPPLHTRIAEHDWSPDEPSAYCRRCFRTVGPHEADDSGCSICRGKSLPWDRAIRLGEYRGLLRDVVKQIKFTRWRRLGDDAGRLLGRQLRIALESADLNPSQLAIVPVPTSWWRRMTRGIDHSLVISRGVAAELGAEIHQLLTRSHRPSQTSVPSSQRRLNVAGAIRLRAGATLPPKPLIVIDDVTTTRATLLAACRALRKTHPVPLWAAVLAVTPDPRARPFLPDFDADRPG